ncbi:hypothetical protein E4M02_02645 [Brevundimonas sp. S30B]|nr:hypothetical protein E4M01_05175 [Brevundimonas sp. MF30-B]TFW04623.1 hypothetical protein E4M02_02645 [Brevundimonas sp. S30B]
MLSGLHGLMTAYSARAGSDGAQVKAWWRLGFGLLAGPIVAEALTRPVILAVLPLLDMRGVALVLGWTATNDPRGIFAMGQRIIKAAMNQEGK